MIDVEQILYKVDSILKTYLNPALVKIDIEKNDGIVLSPIDVNAIFIQELNNETLNYDPYIIHGVSTETIKSNGMSSSSNISLFIVVAISSQNLDNIPKRLMRYSRGIKDIILASFDTLRPELLNTGPVTFQDSNTGNFYKAIGLEFSVSVPF